MLPKPGGIAVAWGTGYNINPGKACKLGRPSCKQILNPCVQEHSGRTISNLSSNAIHDVGSCRNEKHTRIRAELTAAQ